MKNLYFYLLFAVLGFGCSRVDEKECIESIRNFCRSGSSANSSYHDKAGSASSNHTKDKDKYKYNDAENSDEEIIDEKDEDTNIGSYEHYGEHRVNLFEKTLEQEIDRGDYGIVYNLSNGQVMKVINVEIDTSEEKSDDQWLKSRNKRKYARACIKNGLQVTSENVKKIIKQEFETGQLSLSTITKSHNLSICDESQANKIKLEARILMDSVEGISIASLNDSNIKLSFNKTKILFSQVTDSAKEFFNKGLIFYDRRPENVYIQDHDSNYLKLKYIDFGNFHICENNKKIDFSEEFKSWYVDALEDLAEAIGQKEIQNKINDYIKYINSTNNDSKCTSLFDVNKIDDLWKEEFLGKFEKKSILLGIIEQKEQEIEINCSSGLELKTRNDDTKKSTITFDQVVKIYEDNQDKIYMDSGKHDIDKDKMIRWKKKMQDIGFGEFAEALHQNTRYIPFNEYIEKLKLLANDIIELITKENHEVVSFVVSDHLDKSNTWTFLLLFGELYKILKSKNLVENFKNKFLFFDKTGLLDQSASIQAINNYKENSNKKTLILHCDDMSYSGTQIKEHYDTAIKNCPKNRKNMDYYAPLAYISSAARKKLSNCGIKFCSTTKTIIPFVDQIKSNDKAMNQFKEIVNNNTSGLIDTENLVACYFDHKIADNISSFNYIYTFAWTPELEDNYFELNEKKQPKLCFSFINGYKFTDKLKKFNFSRKDELPRKMISPRPFYKTIKYNGVKDNNINKGLFSHFSE